MITFAWPGWKFHSSVTKALTNFTCRIEHNLGIKSIQVQVFNEYLPPTLHSSTSFVASNVDRTKIEDTHNEKIRPFPTLKLQQETAIAETSYKSSKIIMNYQNVTPKSVKIYQLINRKDMKSST